jgi:hypothetical protein
MGDWIKSKLRWVQDEDGDVGLEILGGLVNLVKYKHSVIVYWFRRFDDAPKYVGPI